MGNFVYPKIAEKPAAYLGAWVDLACRKIVHHENGWYFDLGEHSGISADCPWRILDAGHIAHADEDDGQQFGLPKPVVGEERAFSLLAGKKITSVEVAPVSGDLKIYFGAGIALEFFVNSSGYESWQASARNGSHRVNLVAQGGGQISIWEEDL